MRLNIPLLALLLPLAALSQSVPNPVVRFSTNLGDIDVTLLPNSAPKTVANFFNYVNRGDFNNSIFHRSVRNFIIQGGGFQLKNGAPVAIPADPAVKNEFSQSNNRGTLAMAKLGDDPNSATNQWFFNLNNSNAANLNAQNGGFTVFGRVANASSLAVMDAIAAVPVWDSSRLNAAFTELPLLNYTSGTVLRRELRHHPLDHAARKPARNCIERSNHGRQLRCLHGRRAGLLYRDLRLEPFGHDPRMGTAQTSRNSTRPRPWTT